MRYPITQITPDRADQQVSDGWQVARQKDFTGGENPNELTLTPNQFLSAENARVDPITGYLKKIPGNVELVTGSPSNIHQAWVFRKEEGNTYLLTFDSNRYLRAYGPAWEGNPCAYSTGATIYTGSLGAYNLHAIIWKDHFVFSSIAGGDVPQKWTGTVLSVFAPMPNQVRGLAVYGGRLWGIEGVHPILGSVRLVYTETEDLVTYNGLNIIDIHSTDGSQITQLLPQQGGLSIIKTSCVYSLYGTSRFDFQLTNAPIFSHDGCPFVHPGGALSCGVFRGKNDWYKIGLTEVIPMGMPKSYCESVGTSGAYSRRTNEAMFIDSSDTLLRYNLTTGAAWRTSLPANPLALTSLASIDNIDTSSSILFLWSDGIKLWAATEGTNDATRTFKVQTAHADFGTQRDKVFRCFLINVVSSITTTVKYSLDRATLTTAFTGTLTAGDNFIYLHARGKTLSVELSTTAAITIREMGIKFCLAGDDL